MCLYPVAEAESVRMDGIYDKNDESLESEGVIKHDTEFLKPLKDNKHMRIKWHKCRFRIYLRNFITTYVYYSPLA